MSRMQVLVCGSNYGRTYIAAIARQPRQYQLAGILANGSLRSQRLALLNGVPLYLSADEIPDKIDLACAAMSSAAFPVVLQLIRRGIHVLCEHPYPAGQLKKALDLAHKHNVHFQVNGHFANLPAPRGFIAECRQAAKLAPATFVEAMATERSLYAALDILAAAMGKFRLSRVRVLSRWSGFVLLEGALGKTPAHFLVQVSGGERAAKLPDGSPGYMLDQRLTVAFPSGLLTMLSIAGPVLWSRTPVNTQNDKTLWKILGGPTTQSVAELRDQRIRANISALNMIGQSIMGRGTPEMQQPQHILQVSKACELIGRLL